MRGGASKQLRDVLSDCGNARRSPNENDAVELFGGHSRVFERSTTGNARALEKRPYELLEPRALELHRALPRDLGHDGLLRRQRVFRLAGLVEHHSHQLRRLPFAVEAEPRQKLVRKRAIHVVAAESTIPPRRPDLKDAVVEKENGDVERAAAQVVNDEGAVLLLLETIRQRRRRRFVQQSKDLDTRKTCGILGRLPLGIVEIRGNGNDRAADAPQLVLRLLPEGS